MLYEIERMKRIIILIVVSLVFLFFFLCCQQNSTPDLDKVESFMKEHPDSALSYIYRVNPVGFNEAQFARYSLLKSQALYRNEYELSSDSIIRPAVEYYSEHGSDYEKMLTHYYYGEILSCALKYNEAILELEKGAYYGRKIKEEFYFPRILICLGMAYSFAYDAKDSFAPIREAIDIYKRTEEPVGRYYAVFELAEAYECSMQRDSAKIIFKELLESNDSVSVSKRLYTQYGLGICLYKDSLYKESLEMLEPYYAENPDKWTTFAYGILSDLYMRAGNKKRAKEMLDSMSLKNEDDSINFYGFAEMYYRHLGDTKRQKMYADKAREMIGKTMQDQLHNPAVRIQRDEALAALIAKEKESHQRFVMVVILSFCGIVILLLSVFMIRRQIRKNREIKDRIRLKISEYSSEIEKARELINDSRDTGKGKDRLFEELKSAYKIVDTVCNICVRDKDGKLVYNLASSELDYILKKLREKKSESEFRGIVNSEYAGVLDKLKEDFNFTEDDLTMIAWSAVGLSYKTIAIILGKKKGAVATKQTRLRKKIFGIQNENTPLYQKLFNNRAEQ